MNITGSINNIVLMSQLFRIRCIVFGGKSHSEYNILSVMYMYRIACNSVSVHFHLIPMNLLNTDKSDEIVYDSFLQWRIPWASDTMGFRIPWA